MDVKSIRQAYQKPAPTLTAATAAERTVTQAGAQKKPGDDAEISKLNAEIKKHEAELRETMKEAQKAASESLNGASDKAQLLQSKMLLQQQELMIKQMQVKELESPQKTQTPEMAQTSEVDKTSEMDETTEMDRTHLTAQVQAATAARPRFDQFIATSGGAAQEPDNVYRMEEKDGTQTIVFNRQEEG